MKQNTELAINNEALLSDMTGGIDFNNQTTPETVFKLTLTTGQAFK